ncbi:hypothetical protein LINPERPRIM_LOCUS31427, partial [Linum perenne]
LEDRKRALLEEQRQLILQGASGHLGE